MAPSTEIPPQRPLMDDRVRTAWVMLLLLLITVFALYCLFNFRSLSMDVASMEDEVRQESIERSIAH